MGDVYIAYATQQASDALALATRLETAGFATTVVDVDCPRGASYVAWVHETLGQVAVVVALLPETPVERVMSELRLAETLGKPRIAVGAPGSYPVRAEHHVPDPDRTDELARLVRGHGVSPSAADQPRIGRLRSHLAGSRIAIPDRAGVRAPSGLARLIAALARAAGGRADSSGRPSREG